MAGYITEYHNIDKKKSLSNISVSKSDSLTCSSLLAEGPLVRLISASVLKISVEHMMYTHTYQQCMH